MSIGGLVILVAAVAFSACSQPPPTPPPPLPLPPQPDAPQVMLARDWRLTSHEVRLAYVVEVLDAQADLDRDVGAGPTFSKRLDDVKHCVDVALSEGRVNRAASPLSQRYIWACAGDSDDADLVDFNLITPVASNPHK